MMTTVEAWDPDQAVTRGPLDEELEGCSSIDRYGVTEVEEIHGEPLDVALEQEEPDSSRPVVGVDDEWADVEEDEWYVADRMFGAGEDDGPEERAMHVVRP